MKKLEAIRQAVADYMQSEGCDCCQDHENHREAEMRLAKLLNVPEYDDQSGYDFPSFTTLNTKGG